MIHKQFSATGAAIQLYDFAIICIDAYFWSVVYRITKFFCGPSLEADYFRRSP